MAPSGQSGLDRFDDQAEVRAAIEQHDQRVAELRARCTRSDYQLLIINAADGTSIFTVARWGRSFDLPDADAVERWLDRIGAP